MSQDPTERRLRALEAGHDLLVQQNAELVTALHNFDERVAQAIVKATRQLITDPDTLAAVGTVAAELLTKRAQEEAGGWLWGLVKRFASDWLVRVALLLWVAKLAGLEAAAKVWSWFAKG